MGGILLNELNYTSFGSNPADQASSISYENSVSGLQATNAQDAIDEVDAEVGQIKTDYTTRNLLKDTVGWTGKNKLNITANTQTINGVTFTVNRDSNGNALNVIVNGTATAVTVFIMSTYTYEQGEYILSGCPSGGNSDTSYAQQIRDTNNATIINDEGDGKKGTLSNASYRTVIRIGNGYTANNLTFYPMIRRASEKDSTYEPYHNSVKTDLSDFEDDVDDTLHEYHVVPSKNLFSDIKVGYAIAGDQWNKYQVNSNANGFTAIGKVTAGDSYTVSKANLGNRFRIVCFKQYPSGTADPDSVEIIADPTLTEYTFTVPSGLNYAVATFNVNDAYSGDFQAMLCTAADYAADPSYEPYYDTLKDSVTELTEGKLDVKGLLTSSNDLNNVKETGLYCVRNSAPSHTPNSITWYSLLVNKVSDNNVQQQIFTGNLLYQRAYSGNPAQWNSWYKFTGTAI